MNYSTKAIDVDRLHQLFTLNASTGELIRKVSTGPNAKLGNIVGSMLKSGYLEVGIDRKYYRVHRVVFAMANGYWPKLVDHINGDKTDNRPANLRDATHLENARNSATRKDNTSGIKGVSWVKTESRWKAECRVNGIRHRVGYFIDKEQAASAIRAFREVHHHEFARHE